MRRVAGSILLLGCGLAGLPASTAAASTDKMLDATPLVLKDGRIAEVSVHTIPFPEDAVAPASKTRNELGSFTQTIATDCFLTAQVIGHVDKSEASGRETADIHRLARARADTIQASLIESGLPASSIASVWDWRFMVQQARVTLWVFRLTAGEDCENVPLGAEPTDQIAAVTIPERPAEKAGTDAVEASSPDEAKQALPAPVEQKVIAAARPKSKTVTAPIPAPPSQPEKKANAEKIVKAAVEAKARQSGEAKVAALSSDQTIDQKGSTNVVNGGALEIVFATNSSYFPEGAGDQLRAFMKTLDRNERYVLRIQTSVAGEADVSGAASESDAARYNAWLAERRFKRVEAWLLKNSDGLKLTLKPSLVENDGSRRVRIEPNPLG